MANFNQQLFSPMQQQFADENRDPNASYLQHCIQQNSFNNQYINNKTRTDPQQLEADDWELSFLLQENCIENTPNYFDVPSWSLDCAIEMPTSNNTLNIESIMKADNSLPAVEAVEDLCDMNWLENMLNGTEDSVESITNAPTGAARKFYENFKDEIEINDEIQEEVASTQSNKIMQQVVTASEMNEINEIPRCKTRVVQRIPHKIVTLREYRIQRHKEMVKLIVNALPTHKRRWIATTAKEYYERFKWELAEEPALRMPMAEKPQIMYIRRQSTFN